MLNNIQTSELRDGQPSGLPASRRTFSGLLMPLIFLLCCGGCLYLMFSEAGNYVRFPVDAYYYMEMGRNLIHGKGLTVGFTQGVPNKFFPGYPILLGIVSIGSSVDSAWIWLHAVLIPMCGILMAATLWRGGAGRGVAIASAALLVSNYDFVKWATIPYSEAATVFWMLTACLLYLWAGRSEDNEGARPRPRCAYGKWLLAGLAAGMVLLSRPTTVLLVVMLPVYDFLAVPAIRSRRMSLKALITAAVAACLPIALYLAYQKALSGQAVPYVDAYLTGHHMLTPPERFMDSISKLMRQYNVIPPSVVLNVLIIFSLLLFYGIVFPAMRGYIGRGAFLAVWGLTIYLVAHSMWYYSSERFNVIVEPLVAYLLARGLEWLFSRETLADEFPEWKATLYALTVAVVCAVQLLQGYYVIKDHQQALARDAGRPRELALVANTRPGTAWSEMGPEFAYYHDGPTYIDADEPFFYKRTASSTHAYFADHDVRWIVTRKTPDGWFAAHPDMSSATLSLKRQISDGLFTLYEAARKNP